MAKMTGTVPAALVRRAEKADAKPLIPAILVEDIRAALERFGVEFIPENGGGPGVKLRKAVP